MKNVHVAVIDDGVNKEYYGLQYLQNDIAVTDELGIESRQEYDKEINSHGTVCAAIIKKYCPDAAISSVKALDSGAPGNIKKLVKAIEWCIEADVDLINLSIGTNNFEDGNLLREVVAEAHNNGIIIIAANQNEDIITYPASFHNVLGVKCDRKDALQEGEFLYCMEAADGIEIIACGRHSLKNYLGEEKHTTNWNSWAAPMVTSLVAGMLKYIPYASLEQIKRELWKRSLNYHENYSFYEAFGHLNWVSKALIFSDRNRSYNKEKLIFKLEDIVRLDADSFKQELNCIDNYIAENKAGIEAADTIIIDLDREIEPTEWEQLINTAENIGGAYKNLVFLNSHEVQYKIAALAKKYCSKLYINYIAQNCEVFSNNVDVPVIAILDYSGNKLDFLEKMSVCFRNDGYNPILFTDQADGMYYGFHWLPIHSIYKESNRELSKRTNGVVNFFNGDIGIIGINCTAPEAGIIDMMEECLEADLYIKLISSGTDKTSVELYGEKNGILSKEKNRLSTYAQFVIDTDTPSNIQLLYSKILEYFNAN